VSNRVRFFLPNYKKRASIIIVISLLLVILTSSASYIRAVAGYQPGFRIKWKKDLIGISPLPLNPIVIDLDLDSKFETIFATYHDSFYCLASDGEEKIYYEGTPTFLGSFVSVGDINGDDLSEILFSNGHYLHAFDAEGNELWANYFQNSIITKVTVVNINNDDYNEMLFGASDGNLHCVDYLGNELWNFSFGWRHFPVISFADLEDDHI